MRFVCTSAQPSATQIKMLALAARGKTREEIALALSYSPWTVKTYLEEVRGLLGAANNTHAVALAIVAGHLQIDAAHGRVTAVELEFSEVAQAA